jgi:hypothetical protein
MREIYANARQGIIWLGEEAECDRNAFGFLCWLFTHFDQQDDGMKNEYAESSIKSGWIHVKQEQAARFEHLAALLRREWFNRT